MKNKKLNNQFWTLEHDYDYIWDLDEPLYYSHKLKRWVNKKEYLDNGGRSFISGFPCKSYKSALRHLKKHDEIPKGTEFILVSKFIGCSRYLTKK